MNDKLIPLNISLAALFIIVSLVFSRLIPHPPNFTPILATGIFAPYVIRSKYVSIGIVLLAMIISDLFIGFHRLMLFVYLPIILSLLLSDYLKSKIRTLLNFFIIGSIGTVIFFVISNFGVWLINDFYTFDLAGLMECYVMAIPFLKNTLFSTLIYLFAFTIIYKVILNIVEKNFNFKLYWHTLN